MDELTRWAQRSIARGSRSFALASRLFDPATRRRACLLYAWCRHCDDVIDGQEGGQGRVGEREPAALRLAELTRCTRAAISEKQSSINAFGAISAVVHETRMPEAYLLTHLAGYAMDVHERRFRHIEDTLDYCHHVAGVVGEMMAVVMGVLPENHNLLRRAADLGIAFQLTNIARDVFDDAALGRCYIPEDWLAEASIPPGDHVRPEHRGALVGIVGRLLDLADAYYASAREGAQRLPRRSGRAVLAAADIYAAIGAKVRAAGPSAWDHRQGTSIAEKMRFVVSAFLTPHLATPLPPRPPLWKKGDTPDWTPPALTSPPPS
ncbi:phytoene/squalene synthase family protein [Sphingosinicella microcystinivorans]|uniref:Phytoene synthase n=1 Tax=Sphingosinicella microcystinivorans TaxID=335406 RepID=A0AAD1G1D9_SPHMI|nr:phytoene/squalene synthase family protein [Sphingosinicella microcystinivorans]RKS91828.1 phytoene synthase [Sphingosinicella microcystinivorans]BBE34812.1 phytoene synthase [Sphingosinicella microcystinivorans]